MAAGIAGRWSLLDRPNLADVVENQARKEVLAYRGYGSDSYLFKGFPADIRWRRAQLTRSEVGPLLLGKEQWKDLTGGTRKVSVVAKNASRMTSAEDARINDSIASVIERDREGQAFEPLIIVGQSIAGPFVIVEGYTRASAYASTPSGRDVETFVGLSTNIEDWAFWGLS